MLSLQKLKLLRKLTKNTHVYVNFGQNKEKFVNNLIDNFTAPALAAAIYEREALLRKCSMLLEERNYEELENTLCPYKRDDISYDLPQEIIPKTLSKMYLEEIRNILSRIPRQVNFKIYKGANFVITKGSSRSTTVYT